MVEEKIFLCYHVIREERKAFFQYRPGLQGNRRERSKRENNTQEGSCYLRRNLVSDALVLGVQTLVYRVSGIPEKQKEERPRNSGAGLEFSMHHSPGKGKSKRRKLEVYAIGTGQSLLQE